MKRLLLSFAMLLALLAHTSAQNVITFTTSKAVGETVSVGMTYTGDVTIDGVNETAAASTLTQTYTLTKQTVTITISGNVSKLFCSDNSLTSLNVSGCTALNVLECYSNNLTSLNVSGCTALQYLRFANNNLTSLDLSDCTALDVLECYSNNLSSLDLSACTALTYLNCSNNQLVTLDVTANTKLTYLCCDSNLLTELNVNYNKALTTLRCGNNQLTTLNFYSNTALTHLTCSNNQLTRLSLTRNTAITEGTTDNQAKTVECSYINGEYKVPIIGYVKAADISDITVNGTAYSPTKISGGGDGVYYLTIGDLHNMPAVGECVIKYKYNTGAPSSAPDEVKTMNVTLTTTVPAINKITFTTSKAVGQYISMSMTYTGNVILDGVSSNNPVSSGTSGTYKLTSQTVTVYGDVTELDCKTNNLTSLDATNNTALTSLDCSNNNLTSLAVPNCTALSNLNCSSNNLTNLNVTNCTALTELECFGNDLTAFDVTTNTALTTLNCYGNALTDLDVTKNTALTNLWCSSNNLTDLDVTKNTALISLQCSMNKLTNLDVTKNTALLNLVCGSNQLATLDISQNTELGTLDCDNNQLWALDVTKNTKLHFLRCFNNLLTDLDVRNQNLDEFYCQNNQLTALYLGNSSRLDDGDARKQKKTVPSSIVNGKFVVPINNTAENDKISSITVNGTAYSPETNIFTSDAGITYLVFGDVNSIPTGGTCTIKYNYNTSAPGSAYAQVRTMDVTLTTTVPTLESITMETTKAAGETFTMTIDTDVNVLISGVEELATAGTNRYTLTSPTVVVYGPVKKFQCNSEPITSLVSTNTLLLDLTCSSSVKLNTLDVSPSINLRRLTCTGSSLESLDLSNNTLLEYLYVYNNNLTELDLSKNTELTHLTASGNSLETLDLTNNTKLEYVDCSSNKLSDIDVTKNTAMYHFDCNSNKLADIDVSNNLAMTYFDCSENLLEALDVTLNTALETLRCFDNKLTELDVTKNQAMTYFNCSQNKLTELDLTQNTELITLSFDRNRVADIDLSKNVKLKDLSCYHNAMRAIDLSNNTHLGEGEWHLGSPTSGQLLSPQLVYPKPVIAGGYLCMDMPDYAWDGISQIGVTKDWPSTPADYEPTDALIEENGKKYLNFAELEADLHFNRTNSVTYNYDTHNTSSDYQQMEVQMWFRNSHVQKISSVGMGTLYLDYPATVPEGATAWYCTEADIDFEKEVMNYTQREGNEVPANKGFVTMAEPGWYVFNNASNMYPYREEEEADEAAVAARLEGVMDGDILEGTTTDQSCAARSVLTLGKGNRTGAYGFWIYTGTKLSAWRTWIDASYIEKTNGAKGFAMVFVESDTDKTTGIRSTESEAATGGPVYTLSGRKVAEAGNWNEIRRQLPKGVYIVNGKKMVNP